MYPPGEGPDYKELASLISVATVAVIIVIILCVFLVVYYGIKIAEKIIIFKRYRHVPGEEAG